MLTRGKLVRLYRALQDEPVLSVYVEHHRSIWTSSRTVAWRRD